jgi:hypothetical protein
MSERSPSGFEVMAAVVGRVDLGPGTVLVDEESVTLVLAEARSFDKSIRFRIDGIAAVRPAGESVVVVFRDASTVAMHGSPAVREALCGRILDACRKVPELTRALRAMGARRAGLRGDSRREVKAGDEVRFFAPLLAARKVSAAIHDPREILDAFDGPDLAAALDATLDHFAGSRAGDNAPLRRALEAELSEAAEPLHLALVELRLAAESAAADVDDLAAWRRWSARLRATFETADRVWVTLDAMLGTTPAGPLVVHRPKRGGRFGRGLAILFAAALIEALGTRTLAAQHRMLRVVGVPVDTLRVNGLDVVETRGNEVLIVANPDDEQLLRSRGWAATEVPFTGGALRAVGAAAPVVYRSYDDPARGIRAFVDSLTRANSRVRADTIGVSFEGRPMLAVKIGPPDDSPSRPNVFIMATYHAREWAATETSLRLIRHLALAPDARVDSLVRNRDIWVLPVANPDGYQFTFTTDRLWRKNRRPVGPNAAGATVFGVDLNRNHSYRWGFDNTGSSGSVTSDIYRGPTPASELETKAIERFHADHPPVASISYHTYGGLLLFPPGHVYGRLPPDLSIFRALGGTDERPAVPDRLPASSRTSYHAAPGWNLYTTNGEYTDFAYATHGTIAFTPELTSGVEAGAFYGFVFPDDEIRLEALFRDNLPFALDLIESARDPVHFRSQTTGFAVEPVVLESASPTVRLRAPLASTTVSTLSPLAMRVDTTVPGKYFRRLLSDTIGRVPRITVSTAAGKTDFTMLAVGGAEATDTAWRTSGMAPVRTPVVGENAWQGQAGFVRSPVVTVPAGVDTLSILYWTRFDGAGGAPAPHGEVRLSTNRGATWTRVGSVSGEAPVYYPERTVVTNVAGKDVQIEFSSPDGMRWWLDEISIVAHRTTPALVAGSELRPNANPVRGDAVLFNWPFAGASGEIRAYDFAGRLVWRTDVASSAITLQWDLRARSIPNGVYLVVAQSQGDRRTFKLFVTRSRFDR